METTQQHKVTFRISHRLDYINAYCECGFETGSRNAKEFGGLWSAKDHANKEHEAFVKAGA
jgi:hypothetical protein